MKKIRKIWIVLLLSLCLTGCWYNLGEEYLVRDSDWTIYQSLLIWESKDCLLFEWDWYRFRVCWTSRDSNVFELQDYKLLSWYENYLQILAK